MNKIIGFITLCISLSANAASFGTFQDRTTFEAFAGSLSTETFDSFAADTSFDTVPLDVGDFTLSRTGAPDALGLFNKIDVAPLTFLTFNVDGTNIASLFTTTMNSVFLTFDNPIFAFGADFGEFQNNAILTDIVVGSDILTPSINSSFFGLISDTAFNVLEFRGRDNDGFGMDNVSYSFSSTGTVAVPAPSAIWLLTVGLVAFAGMRRTSSSTLAA